MYKGNAAKLRMKRNLVIGNDTEDTQFDGEVLHYNECEGSLLLILKTGELTQLSLDAIYLCEMQTNEQAVCCTGTIVDRCCDEEGEIVKIKIQNGFYKINIK